MADRRTEILDTALHVLAEHGMRGLTHRGVDAAGGLPQGSTSYYFRTRDALVTGCLQRLLELDAADLPSTSSPPDLDTMVDMATELCVRMVHDGAHRTMARYELSLHAVRSPRLRDQLVAAGTVLRKLGAERLAGLGVADPLCAAEEITALMDGLVFTALLRGPDDPRELRRWFSAPLHRLLSTHLQLFGFPAARANP
jgi:DNA-binding transcriptional regulator YbjK